MINVRDFGAVGGDVVADTRGFKDALASLAVTGGGECYAPPGTYLIQPEGITLRGRPAVTSNVRLFGDPGQSILKINGSPSNPLLQCTGDLWQVEGLTFDMGDYTSMEPSSAIHCKGDLWLIDRCSVIRSGRVAITVHAGDGWEILNNYIQKTTPTAQPPTSGILVTNGANGEPARNHTIKNCLNLGAGISFMGENGSVIGNRVIGSASGTGIFVTRQGSRACLLQSNVCSDGKTGPDDAQGGRQWSVNGIESWAPETVYINNICHDNDGGGLVIGGENSIVLGNKAYNNGRFRPGFAGIAARTMQTASASGSVFIGNSSYDTRYPGPTATQSYGYQEQSPGANAPRLQGILSVMNRYERNVIENEIYRSIGGMANATFETALETFHALVRPEVAANLLGLSVNCPHRHLIEALMAGVI